MTESITIPFLSAFKGNTECFAESETRVVLEEEGLPWHPHKRDMQMSKTREYRMKQLLNISAR